MTRDIQLEHFQNFLATFLEEAKTSLSVAGTIISKESITSLIITKAANLNNLNNNMLILIQDLYTLQNPEFLAWIKNEISKNLHKLNGLQEKYKIHIVNIPKNGMHPLFKKIPIEEKPSNTKLPKPLPNPRLNISAESMKKAQSITPEELKKRWDAAEIIINNSDSNYSGLYPVLSRDQDKKVHDTFYDSYRSYTKRPPKLYLIDTLCDAQGNTLLHLAVKEQNASFVDWLLFYSASVLKKNLENKCPLELGITFIDTTGTAIFHKLISQAQGEAFPDQQGVTEYDVLLESSTKFVGALFQGLTEYNLLVIERNASLVSIIRSWFANNIFNANYTIERNKSQTQAYLAIKDAEMTRDYPKLLVNLEQFNQVSNTGNSALHKMLAKSLIKES